jgi:endonuclease/exonuclease/phosphatase family metal-dependent hydrolase
MKLVTWNTQWCCGVDGVVSPARIVEGARALADFDVLCLQEIAVNYPNCAATPTRTSPRRWPHAARLPAVLRRGGRRVRCHGARRRFGNLVATRLPVAQVQHHPLPWPADDGVRSMPRMCTVVTVLDPQLGPVRIMTTHLEFYSKPQRMAQARPCASCTCEYVGAGPGAAGTEQRRLALPVQGAHRERDPLRRLQPAAARARVRGADQGRRVEGRLWDSWRLLHGDAPHQPTFLVHERSHGPESIACDFVFVSDGGLKDRVRRIAIDGDTQASDHQPVLLELANFQRHEPMRVTVGQLQRAGRQFAPHQRLGQPRHALRVERHRLEHGRKMRREHRLQRSQVGGELLPQDAAQPGLFAELQQGTLWRVRRMHGQQPVVADDDGGHAPRLQAGPRMRHDELHLALRQQRFAALQHVGYEPDRPLPRVRLQPCSQRGTKVNDSACVAASRRSPHWPPPPPSPRLAPAPRAPAFPRPGAATTRPPR